MKTTIQSIIIVIAVIILLFYASVLSSEQSEQLLVDTDGSEQWQTFTYDTFGQHTASRTWFFPHISLSFPQSWTFSGGGDMFEGSGSVMRPQWDEECYKGTSGSQCPGVSLFHYGLRGCPENHEGLCDMSDVVGMTPDEKFDELIRNLPEDTDVRGKRYIPGLDRRAYVYRQIREDSGSESEVYLINDGNDVFSIAFIHHSLISDAFVDRFLDNIGRHE